MKLDYFLLLPLQQIALRKVIGLLWNKIDILAEIDVRNADPFEWFSILLGKWIALVGKKAELVENHLNASLLKDVLPIITPLGLEILGWIYFHVEFLCYRHTYFESRNPDANLYKGFDRIVLQKLSWTSVGTINYKKTAQELIRAKILNVIPLYKLACLYCLEDCVSDLWQQLPEMMKVELEDEQGLSQRGESHLSGFWRNLMRCHSYIFDDMDRGLFQDIPSFYQHAFEMSAYARNKAAAEYFYKKLNVEKEAILIKTAEAMATKRYSEVVKIPYYLGAEREYEVYCYFLSRMKPEQQLEFLKAHPYNILKSLLSWPWFELFSDFAQFMWDFLPEEGYYNLLLHFQATNFLSKYYKPDLFTEYFRSSPEKFKNYFIDQECQHGNFIYNLFVCDRLEIVRFIFGNVDASAIARLVLCDQGRRICTRLIHREEWHLMKQLLEDSKLSEEDTANFKEYWKSYISRSYKQSESKILEWEKLFNLSPESHRNISCKRSLEDEEGDKLKKVCKHTQ